MMEALLWLCGILWAASAVYCCMYFEEIRRSQYIVESFKDFYGDGHWAEAVGLFVVAAIILAPGIAMLADRDRW